MEKFDLPALHGAVVNVSKSVKSADRHVVGRTLVALLILLAASIVFFGDSFASNNAVIMVSNSIMSANRLKEVSGTLAAGRIVARAEVLDPEILAVQQAEIVVGVAIFSANWIDGDILTGTARSVSSEVIFGALEPAEVVILLVVG
jgi:hypothetical protein